MKWDTSHLLIKKDMLIFFLITKKGYNSVSRSGNNEVSSYSTSCIVYKKCLTPFFCHPGSFQAQICIGAYTIFSRDFFEHNLENYATLHYQWYLSAQDQNCVKVSPQFSKYMNYIPIKEVHVNDVRNIYKEGKFVSKRERKTNTINLHTQPRLIHIHNIFEL